MAVRVIIAASGCCRRNQSACLRSLAMPSFHGSRNEPSRHVYATPDRRTRVSSSGKAGTAFGKQLPQDRSVASTLVVAIASDRKISSMGERGQKIENLSSVRSIHFRSEPPPKIGPRSFVVRRLAFFHECLTGRKIGQPNVVKILLGIFGLRNSSGRSANRA
jgi:hypothetical protein